MVDSLEFDGEVGDLNDGVAGGVEAPSGTSLYLSVA